MPNPPALRSTRSRRAWVQAQCPPAVVQCWIYPRTRRLAPRERMRSHGAARQAPCEVQSRDRSALFQFAIKSKQRDEAALVDRLQLPDQHDSGSGERKSWRSSRAPSALRSSPAVDGAVAALQGLLGTAGTAHTHQAMTSPSQCIYQWGL